MERNKRIVSARLGEFECRIEIEDQFPPSLETMIHELGRLWEACFGQNLPGVGDVIVPLEKTLEPELISFAVTCARCSAVFQAPEIDEVQAQILAHKCPHDFPEIGHLEDGRPILREDPTE